VGEDDDLVQGRGAAEWGEHGVDEAFGDAAAEEPVVAALGGAESGKIRSLGWGQQGKRIIAIERFA
jgi:hypothetical protein